MLILMLIFGIPVSAQIGEHRNDLHEIMNTITPVTSLSETLLTRVTEDKDLKQGLETIHKTGTEL